MRWISKNWQGRVWSGKHFNSDSRLGSGPASDLILGYYLVFSGLVNIKYFIGKCLIFPSFLHILKEKLQNIDEIEVLHYQRGH